MSRTSVATPRRSLGNGRIDRRPVSAGNSYGVAVRASMNHLNTPIAQHGDKLGILRNPAIEILDRIPERREDQILSPRRLAREHIAESLELFVVRGLDGVDQIKDAAQGLRIGVQRVVQPLNVVRLGRQPVGLLENGRRFRIRLDLRVP